MPEKNDKNKQKIMYMPIGLALGAGLGSAFGNIAIGISLGILLGGIIDMLMYLHNKKKL